MRGPGLRVALGAVVALLTACGSADAGPVDEPTQPPPRTTWALRHRVVESDDLKVIGHTIGHYDEATGVTLGPSGAESCYASVSAPGQGGPDRMVGDKVPTQFRGGPAVRNGPGAEGAYLMWQLPDRSWVAVSCDDPDDTSAVDVVAAAVQLTTSSVSLPFGLTALPKGYGVSQIMQDRSPGSTRVYVGPMLPPFDMADSDIEIVYEARDPLSQPDGRTITVGGRPALLDEDRQHPEVCVAVQARHVCVRPTPSDTGPYPNRSAEIPTLLALAGALSYPVDLDDQSTWFAAETVFG